MFEFSVFHSFSGLLNVLRGLSYIIGISAFGIWYHRICEALLPVARPLSIPSVSAPQGIPVQRYLCCGTTRDHSLFL